MELLSPTILLDCLDLLLAVVETDGLAVLLAADLGLTLELLAPKFVTIRALCAIALLHVLLVGELVVSVRAGRSLGKSLNLLVIAIRILITVLAILRGIDRIDLVLLMFEFTFPTPFKLISSLVDTLVMADSF